ncbi:MAG: tRNA preQ1(34) S-adenosylmethionine ribosyltransferase-isomerase QueA [Clostridia bacterium]|jgi:S-adenosylmethionine:tRNA ribosyltransferase-isomerase|nr:tRNA preQ1(34) S-adenosylmethionine ribosyltransferase-isomerase QueA [Clostridia bacterium]
METLKDYYYELPQELIAQQPAIPRDSARLLVYNIKTKVVEHKIFKDVIEYLNKGDVLVINTTKVLPARLFGIKIETGAKIEILLERRLDLKNWEVLAKPAKRLKNGTIIKFNDRLSSVVTGDTDFGGKTIEFIFSGIFEDVLNATGLIPLPHYITQELKDKSSYQTVYCKQGTSSAAPTAGLHFTPELLQTIKDKGIIVAEVLLNVGLGTFRPVKENDITKHKMHTEYCEILPQVAKIINLAKQEHRRIVAVGTTSARTLESMTDNNGIVQSGFKNTDIFIYPPYNFKSVDALITNFHLPESTLVMLVSALIGREETLNLYKIAVEEKYRFFSFGDAMFIM